MGNTLDESGTVERSRPLPDSAWEAGHFIPGPFKTTGTVGLMPILEGGVPGVDAPVRTNFGTHF